MKVSTLRSPPEPKSHHQIFKMLYAVVALIALLQAVQGGVVPAPAAVVPGPARLVAAPAAAPFIAAPAPAPLIAAAPAPFVAPAAAPIVAAAPAAAPIVAAAPAAYAKAVPQAVAPFTSSVNFVARAPLLPYTVAGGPVVSPFVETFSAPLVARRFAAPVAAAAPLVAAPAPFVV